MCAVVLSTTPIISAPQVSSSCQELTNSERSITANISGHDNTFADPVSFCVTNNRDNIVLTNSTRETELPTIDMPGNDLCQDLCSIQDACIHNSSPAITSIIHINSHVHSGPVLLLIV